MAGKMKSAKLESDIDRLRAEANWSKLLDLTKQISSKVPHFEFTTKFIQCECKLERYCIDNPLLSSNQLVTPGSPSQEAQTILKELLEVSQMEIKSDLKQDAFLLLGKMYYMTSQYDKALKVYEDLQLDDLSVVEANSRKMKLIGEAFAIKGICLEKSLEQNTSTPDETLTSQRNKETEDLIIQCFEKSGDISLYQLQERQEKGGTKVGGVAVQGGTGVWSVVDGDAYNLSPIVEHAVQKFPLMYIRKGDLQKGIGRFRDLLRVVESKTTQGLRQVLARQLAEVLMKSTCRATYVPVAANVEETPEAGMVKPKKYSGDGLFVPKDDSEEALLLLLISESIATREVVLNRSTELSQARALTLHNATAVYDLLTICLARKAQFNLLADTYEKAMKFSFNEFHIWYQFALSLMCSQKYTRSYLVLKECIKLEPQNTTLYMLAAKLCYEHLNLVEDGIQHSEKAIEILTRQPGSVNREKSDALLNSFPTGEMHKTLILAKCHLFLGIGYSIKTAEMKMLSERQACQKMALESIAHSLTLDPSNHLTYFHMAHQMAMIRKIPEALVNVRKALELRQDHPQSLHLLVLLLTSQKHNEEASKLIDATLVEFPDDFSLMFTKCKIDSELGHVELGLHTCKQMLLLWKKVFEASFNCSSDERGTGLLERITSDARSLLQIQLYDITDRESGSTKAESVAASRLEHALSEVASSINSGFQPRGENQQAWTLQAQIWLLLAELYLKMDKTEAAHACIQEAGVLCPMSHIVSYTRGRYYEARDQLSEARRVYENAVSINPCHVKSLLRLGIVLHKLGNDRLAETTLRSAVSCDPTSSSAWRALGQVLQSLGESTVATDCLMTALELEQTDPILPFTIIHRVCT